MATFTLPTNLASVEGFIGALYGYAIGSSTMTQVNADIVSYGGLNNTLNAYYSAAFGSQSTSSVAASIVTNLGIVAGQNGLVAADVTQAVAYVTGVLNSTAANARGASVLSVVNLFNGLAGTTGSLANFSSAATAWGATLSAAVKYAGSNATDVLLATAVATGSSAIYTFNGSSPTWTSGLSVGNGAVSTLTLNDTATTAGTAATVTLPSGTTVNVGTININGGTSDAITANLTTSGWPTAALVNVYGSAAQTITAAATQPVVATSTANGAITVNGGSTVSITATSNDSAGAMTPVAAISVGGTTAPAGLVTITETTTLATALSTPRSITVTGGAGATVVANENIGLGVASANAGTISVSPSAITSGPVSITLNESNQYVGSPAISIYAPAITVTGGTVDTITQTSATIQSAKEINLLYMGAVTVTGDSNTTTVTVNQAADTHSVSKASGSLSNGGAKVTTAAAAVVGVNAVTGVLAGSGINAFSSVAQTTTAAAITGYGAGSGTLTNIVTAGAVTIGDKNGSSTSAVNTISTVSLNNYGTAGITTSALTTLNLSGKGGATTLTNNAAVPAITSLTINTNATAPVVTSTTTSSNTNAFTDAKNVLKTINIVNTGTSAIVGDSQLLSTTAITGTSLANVAISGSGVLTLGAFGTAPTSVTVTGTVGFTGYLAGTSTSLDASGSTGVVTVFVGATDVTKTIKGSTATGNEIVFSGAGSSVYSGTGKVTSTNVTGFTTLGLTAAAAGTWDMSKFAGYTSIDIINNANKTNGYQFAAAGNGAFTFTNVVAGTNIQIQGSNSGALSYTTTDTNGSSDSVTITIGNSGNTSTSAIALTGAITLQDSNSTGLGTVNIVTNAGTSTSNTIAFGSLADTNISVLNISGTGGLASSDTTAYSDSANSLIINNTTTVVPASVAAGILPNYAVNLYGISDSSLGSLTFNGTNSTYIGTLTDGISNVGITSNSTANVAINTFVANTSSAAGSVNVITFNGSGNIDIGTLTSAALTLTLKNSGTGTVTVGDGLGVASSLATNFTALTDTTFTTLNLTGNVAFGTNATVLASAATANTTTYSTTAVGNAAGSSSTSTLTVSGATDNAHVNIKLSPNTSSTSVVHSITLGNGNNYITDLSTKGTVNVTVGTGYNLIDVGAGADASFNSTITLGAHSSTTTAYNLIEVSVLTGYSGPYVANTVISGISANDVLYVGSNANNYSVAGVGYIKTLTANQLSTAAAYSTASGAVNYVQSLSIGANTITVFNWSGNTYLLADAAASETTLQNGDSLVELIGIHTINSTISATGIVTIAS